MPTSDIVESGLPSPPACSDLRQVGYPKTHWRAERFMAMMRDMRISIVLVALLAGCMDKTETPAAPDASVQVDHLAARMALCGQSPGEAPVLDPATVTDSHGYQYIALSVDHWNADAAYITASQDWMNCITYGVKP